MRTKAVRRRDHSPTPQAKGNIAFPAFSLCWTKLFVQAQCKSHTMRVVMVRPLIPLNRGDLTKLCLAWGLPLYPDATNSDMASPRNRIRRDLLPALRILFNQHVDNVLSQSSEILSAEQMCFELVASKLSKSVQDGHENVQLSLVPIGIRRTITRYHLQVVASQKRRLRFSSLEALLQRNEAPTLHSR
jgi:tRNA(Ile)-lysidine synthase TilS/MesJ